jgi:ABC-type Mn2+/Zn2+ transport system ATPase subunit
MAGKENRMKGVEVRGLSVGYGKEQVAFVPSLRLDPDRITLIVGPNGAGKTTLLKTLGGLAPPLAGSIEPRLPRGRGGSVYVHSAPYLFGGSVARNLRLVSGGNSARARGFLEELGSGELWARPVATLSTGQRQRVALARALAAEPALLLVDEPEGGLDDEALRRWSLIVKRALENRRPILVVAAHRPVSLGGLPVQIVPIGPAAAGSRRGLIRVSAGSSQSAEGLNLPALTCVRRLKRIAMFFSKRGS